MGSSQWITFQLLKEKKHVVDDAYTHTHSRTTPPCHTPSTQKHMHAHTLTLERLIHCGCRATPVPYDFPDHFPIFQE